MTGEIFKNSVSAVWKRAIEKVYVLFQQKLIHVEKNRFYAENHYKQIEMRYNEIMKRAKRKFHEDVSRTVTPHYIQK
jgi:hypothetical protein